VSHHAKAICGARNELIGAANGIDCTCRGTGADDGTIPLVLLQHFRGNLDNWDPALVDALASTRRVVTFDNAGVGGSTGTTPDTVEQMARDAIAFLGAMRFGEADLAHYYMRESLAARQLAVCAEWLQARRGTLPQGCCDV
jgi:pimeloyl-ACP methyl ester carboxylesterase